MSQDVAVTTSNPNGATIDRKARFVYESLLERRIVGAETLTRYAIDVAAHVLAKAPIDPVFVLDRTGNPHPQMLAEAWELRTAAEGVIGLPGKGAAQVLG